MFLKIKYGVAFALGKQGNQNIRAGDFLPAGGLHMDGGALQHTLECVGWFCVFGLVIDERIQFLVDIGCE